MMLQSFGVSLLMHNSILVSHSESLVADGEHAAVGTDKYLSILKYLLRKTIYKHESLLASLSLSRCH